MLPEPGDPWGGAPRQKLILRSQNLVLELPDGKSWEVLPRKGSFSGLAHAESGSQIWVRHALARRTVSLSECEEQARWGLGYMRESLETAHERVLTSPPGYGGTLRVFLLEDGGAQVVLISVGVSRCLAVVYRTEGKSGFAQRMQVIINETLTELRVPDIAERGVTVR